MPQNDLERDLSVEDREVASSDEIAEKVDQDEVYDPLAPIEGESSEVISDQTGEADTADPEEDELEDSTAQPAKSYLEDDEEWAAAADEILHQDEVSVIAQQDEAVVSWDINGLYDEFGKVRSKRSLKNNPPTLIVSDSNGDTASFVLTKDLSGVLARHMENTNRAYYGIRPKSERSMKEKLGDAKAGLRENMGKAIVIGGILLGLLIFGLFF